MTIERAAVRISRKPWGSTDLLPWSTVSTNEGAIGELWFQRANAEARDPLLLLKLLFTTAPLSIQVHPDDAFARSIGLENGKTEAWYILAAQPGAQVGVGLTCPVSSADLRTAIVDGSIGEMMEWRSVRESDVIFIAAGTIHTIGAGIVLAEIQQRSDTTFRLFDYGRQRELHMENAIAAAQARPSQYQSPPRVLNEARTALIISSHFVLEHIGLPPNSIWRLDAKRETWMLVLEGHVKIGLTIASVGDAIFMEADRAEVEVGFRGMRGLLTYIGPDPDQDLLIERSNRAANPGCLPGPSLQIAIQKMSSERQRGRERDSI
jgi:mannose-6-phosphate isomerase